MTNKPNPIRLRLPQSYAATSEMEDNKLICSIHGGLLVSDLTRRTIKGYTYYYCRHCYNKEAKEFAQRVTMALVRDAGGECVICGYDCRHGVAAFDFHHVNPANKSFTIGGNHCRSYAALKKEADKCVLLCSNCHRNIHAGTMQLPQHLIDLKWDLK